MKILSRKDFLKTPRGTLYSYYDPCSFSDLSVKTSDSTDYENDFVYFSLIGEFKVPTGKHFLDVCQELEDGKSIPLSLEETRREGLFNDEQLFLVYERSDIAKMVKVLSKLK